MKTKKLEINLEISHYHDDKERTSFKKSMLLNYDSDEVQVYDVKNALVNLYEGIEFADRERLLNAQHYINEILTLL